MTALSIAGVAGSMVYPPARSNSSRPCFRRLANMANVFSRTSIRGCTLECRKRTWRLAEAKGGLEKSATSLLASKSSMREGAVLKLTRSTNGDLTCSSIIARHEGAPLMFITRRRILFARPPASQTAAGNTQVRGLMVHAQGLHLLEFMPVWSRVTSSTVGPHQCRKRATTSG